jgi:archaetidylinositol phosphate synthase
MAPLPESGINSGRYGFYVDHVSDAIGASFLIAGLSVSGYIHPQIAFGMLIAFLLLSIESYLATYTLGRFQLSYWKFGPTEIRVLLAIGNLALLRHSVIRFAGHDVLLFDLGGIIAIAGMVAMLVASAVRHTVQLYRAERIL